MPFFPKKTQNLQNNTDGTNGLEAVFGQHLPRPMGARVGSVSAAILLPSNGPAGASKPLRQSNHPQ